ncbi:hypothetical protein ABW21_db0204985 [Orbilia brochopaga]|nr:hypothetical protein ABW21_db0204985 [Drechslerella brochopaga]
MPKNEEAEGLQPEPQAEKPVKRPSKKESPRRDTLHLPYAYPNNAVRWWGGGDYVAVPKAAYVDMKGRNKFDESSDEGSDGYVIVDDCNSP